MFWKRKNTKKEVEQTLADIVRGIAHAVSTANEIQDQQFLKQFDHFFEKQGESLVAKEVKVKVHEDKIIKVPLISLINPSYLELEEMCVKMGIRLTETEVKKSLHQANHQLEISRSSFGVALTDIKPGTKQNVIGIEMKFKKMDQIEGVARIQEELRASIELKQEEESKQENEVIDS